MEKFLLSDFFFGILLTLFVAGSYKVGTAFLETFELKCYDLHSGFRQDQSQPTEVAILAIDDDSLAHLGTETGQAESDGTLRIEPGGQS